MHRDDSRSGSPVVVYNRGATTVPPWPGAMIVPADGTRRMLTIQAGGNYTLMIFPRSGSDAQQWNGFQIYGPSGLIELSAHDDPDLVVAEWWAYSLSQISGFVGTIEEIYR